MPPIPQVLLQSGHSERTLRDTELVIVTPCAAHDAQSSFRWGMRDFMKDRMLLRDCYVGVEALRHSLDLIAKHMAEWVGKRIEFVPDRPESVEQRRILFASLDIDNETTDVLASVLQYHFEDGAMHVTENIAGHPDLMDLITTALHSAFKFTTFTDSRFLSVGVSSRSVVAALVLGVRDLVDVIKQDPGSSKFYLGGFDRLFQDSTRMLFVAQAAFVSRVADGVLASVMEDPRVALNHDELWDALCNDMKFVLNIDGNVWEAVAAVAGCEAEDLRAQSLRWGSYQLSLSVEEGTRACRSSALDIGSWRYVRKPPQAGRG